MTATSPLFSLDDLAAFERPEATVERSETHAGCRVNFANGWVLSIQWGACTYSGNHHSTNFETHAPDSITAECAAWKDGGEMLPWARGDTVAGWMAMEHVQALLDLMAKDKVPSPLPEWRA